MADERREELKRLILGELAVDARDALEARVLSEPDLLDLANEVEAELADAHARGQLSSERRAAWEARLRASLRLRERTAFAQALAAVASKPATATPPAARPLLSRRSWAVPALPAALAAGLLLAVGGASWLAVELSSARREVAASRAERDDARRAEAGWGRQRAEARSRIAELSRQLDERLAAAPAVKPRLPSLVRLAFGLGAVRGGAGTPRAVLTPEAEGLRLEAAVESVDAYSSFRALVETEDGEPVFLRSGLTPSVPRGFAAVGITVPADVLAAGTYVLSLEARAHAGSWETLARHEFRVTRP